MLQIFKKIKIEIFGASHSQQIGVSFDGIKKGLKISEDNIQSFVDRRKPTASAWSTSRIEGDKVEFLSGIKNGYTTGDTITAIINNTNQKRADYENLKHTPRPSHADYVAMIKYNNLMDMSGGGKFSGRMTAPLCIAGAIAIDILKSHNIEVGAYISEIGSVKSKTYKSDYISLSEIRKAQKKTLPTLSESAKEEMEKEIISAKSKGDSIGGSIESIVYGLPVGLGDCLFDGLEGRISASVFAIPAVKAIEFGSGFDFVQMRGSKANDAFAYDKGKVVTKTNHNGGINGGISNGMNLTLRVAFKPTPSISIEQDTVDLLKKENSKITIQGRHDSCIVPRAVPCVEAMVALVILDALLENKME